MIAWWFRWRAVLNLLPVPTADQEENFTNTVAVSIDAWTYLIKADELNLKFNESGTSVFRATRLFGSELTIQLMKGAGARKRLVKYIEHKAMETTFVNVSKEVGLDEKTIRTIFTPYSYKLNSIMKLEMPTWLGLDEINLRSPRCVVADVYNSVVIDLLPDRNLETISRRLQSLFSSTNRIQYVSMDFSETCRDSVRAVFPNATIMVDKIHVLQLMNKVVQDFLLRLPRATRQTMA